MTQIISPLAGKPAPRSSLVDIPKLVSAYYSNIPDPAEPSQRVAFGTSGHRGNAFDGSFNERHVLAITQAICDYRAAQGHRRAAVHRHRHARAVRARAAQRAGGAGGQRRRHHAGDERRVHADAGGVARDHHAQPRAHVQAGRRHRRHAVAQPARQRRLQVQPDQRRPGRRRHHEAGAERGQRVPREGPRGRQAHDVREGARRADHASPRLPRVVCGRPRQRGRHGRDPRLEDPPGRRPAGRRRRALLEPHRRPVPARPHRRQRRRRPDLRLHDDGLGRQDPHGSVVALRDGAPGRPEEPVRRRLRLRHRPRPPRHRHAQRRPDAAQRLPRGVHRLPVPQSPAMGRSRRRSARRWCRRA